MRLMKCMMLGLGLVISTFVFYSCLDDDGYSLDKAWYSIATVRPLEDSNSYWFTLDNGTSLWPVATNIPWYKPEKKQRVLIVYSLLSDDFQGYDNAVKILDLRSILTKPVAENLGEENDEIYGTDPVDISEMWIGDGYLNIVFEFNYGDNAVHYINLIETHGEKNMPYVFEFRHHAYNDEPRYRRKGIVCFDLFAEATRGEEVEFLISANTFEGNKQYIIRYNPSNSPAVQDRHYLMESFIETK